MTLGTHRILIGDVIERLRELPDRSVHCIVTSPPYWGLRSYASNRKFDTEAEAAAWSAEMVVLWNEQHGTPTGRYEERPPVFDQKVGKWRGSVVGVQRWADGSWCEYGLEKTPEEYIKHTVEVCRELWRVLRDDGTLWLNLGDSYAASGATGHGGWDGNNKNPDGTPRRNRQAGDKWSQTPTAVSGLKPKDLCGIP